MFPHNMISRKGIGMFGRFCSEERRHGESEDSLDFPLVSESQKLLQQILEGEGHCEQTYPKCIQQIPTNIITDRD